ncbi:hypothetical protein [Amycolatopsis plumensis]|uniref:Secreted protein n=2 Tax=Amycolatopsis plumensis TaxID=236508 RepID=A0ABV5U7R9_9PSEU
MTLGLTAAAVTATAGVASAAPPGFTVNLNHSSGVPATAVSGKLAWSTSLKTVTVTGMTLFIRAGECADLTVAGFQGSTRVTDTALVQDCADVGVNETWPFEPFGLTSSVPGWVEHVIVRLTDRNRQIGHYANCYRTASTCAMG